MKDQFEKILKKKLFLNYVVRVLLYTFSVVFFLSLFFPFYAFWRFFLLAAVVLGLLFAMQRTKKVISYFDRNTNNKMLITAAFEFCKLELPGSQELKEKIIENSIFLLGRSKLHLNFLERMLKISFIILIIFLIPRFSPNIISFDYSDIKTIPDGDSILFYGDTVTFKMFPVSTIDSQLIIINGNTFHFDSVLDDTILFILEYVTEDISFKFFSEEKLIKKGIIDVISPDLIVEEVNVELPEYAGGYRIPSAVREKYILPEKSIISFKLRSLAPVDFWIYELEDKAENQDENNLILSHILTDTSELFIKAVSVLGDTLSSKFLLIPEPDRPPLCIREKPTEDVFKFGFFENVELQVRVEDDYLLTKAVLYLEERGDRISLEDIYIDRKGPLYLSYKLNDEILSIGPGETAFFYVSVQDNYNYQPGHFSRCEPVFVVFPTMSEIFNMTDSVSYQYTNEVQSIKDRGERILFDLENLQQKLKLNEGMLDGNNFELHSLISEHENLLNQLINSTDDMQNVIENILSQSATDNMILDKSREIAELFDYLLSEEEKERFKELFELSKSTDREEVLKALEELRENSEELLSRMERTLEMLRRLQLERKLEELVARSLELTEKTMDLTSESEEIESINEELSDILSDLEKIEDFCIPPDVQSEIEKAEEFGSSAQMEMSDMQESGNISSSMNRSLARMTEHLQKASDMLREGRTNEIFELIEKIREDLLDISELEERIYLGRVPDYLSSAAFKSMIKITEKFDSLTNMSMFIDMSMITIFKEITESLKEADEISDHRYIFRKVNESILMLEKVENQIQYNMMSSGESGNMQQELAQTAGEQAELNMQSMEGFLSGMTPMQQGAMAVAQKALSERLSEMSGGYQGSAKLLSELEDIAREMEAAAFDLERGEISRPMIERQRNILQKLLDSQRAMREQQQRPQRIAQTAEDYEPYIFEIGIDNIFDKQVNTGQIEIPSETWNSFSPYLLKMIERYNNYRD